MAKDNSLIGVGLGNYFDNLPNNMKTTTTIIQNEAKWNRSVITNPHNIFFTTLSETGILGLLSFTILIGYFLYRDLLAFMQRKTNLHKILMLCFWGLFIFSIINPATVLQYLIMFWLLRALIVKEYFVLNRKKEII
jgi:O-antigen ligase